ncbi:YbaN family protein [Teredinibacter purpureus]|uniref:YbaN family protein n=1 Tax=Teredinibacter purpureus TaxID=2731756 RepID=UPI0005F7CDA3|nr:YbaN family protein [Teredinibacter purpureus]
MLLNAKKHLPLWKKIALISIGWVAVLLGLAGIFLPILPTTPFLILAASCFANSSERFHRWLLNSPLFGPIISDWQQKRAIQAKTKRWAILVVLLTFGSSIFIVPSFSLKLMLLVMLCICLFFIIRLKETV